MANLFQRLTGATLPAVRPMKEQGVSGTSLFGGYVRNHERSSKWVGQEKYRTSSDIAVNISIVAAGLHYFLNLVSHPEWSVKPADDDNEEAVKMAEFVEYVLHDMETPWSNVVRRAGMYRFHGFGVQEWVAKKIKEGEHAGKVGFHDVEARPQFTVERWEIDDDGSVLGCWQRSPQTGALLGLPRGKLVYLVDDTLSDNPEGIGLFRHMAEPYERLKRYLELEAYGFERDLRGTVVGRAPLTQLQELVHKRKITQADADKLVAGVKDFTQIEAKQKNTGIMIDSQPYTAVTQSGTNIAATPQWNVELLTGTAAGLAELAAAVERIQMEIARIMGVEHLMMGSGEGSRAVSEDKSRNIYLIANSVLKNIAFAFERDILDPLWTLNGFDDELKPSFAPEDVAFKSVMEITDAIAKMSTAGAVLAPDDPIINDVRDLLGVSRAPEMTLEQAGAIQQAMNPTPPGEQMPSDNGGSFLKPAFGQKPGQPAPGAPPAPKGTGSKTPAPKSTSKADWFDFEKYDPNQPRAPKGSPEGGRWTAGGGSSGDVDERVKAAAAKLPQGHLKLIAQTKVTIEDEAVYDGKEAMGFFNPKDNSILISRNWRGIPLADPESTIVHEMGHALDHATGRKLRTEIAPIVQQEINANLTRQEYFDAMPFIITPAEMFAEMYALSYGSGNEAFGMPIEIARSKFSRSIKYMENVLSLHKAAGKGKKPPPDPTANHPDGYFINSRGDLYGMINGSAYPLKADEQDICDAVGRLQPGFYTLDGEFIKPAKPAWAEPGYGTFEKEDNTYYAVVFVNPDELAKAKWDETEHPRDPKGSETGGQFTAAQAAAREKEKDKSKVQFHGTTASLASIREKGLTPGFESSVFLARDRNTAALYARTEGDKVGVVLEVHIPDDGWEHFRHMDSKKLKLSILETNLGTGIPKEWIKGYYTTAERKRFGQGSEFYVNSDLIPLDKDPTKKYSPDQPRHPSGNPDGGQWMSLGIVDALRQSMGSEGKKAHAMKVAREVAEEYDLDPNMVFVQDETIQFDVGGKTWNQAGLADLEKGTLTLNVSNMTVGEYAGVAAHEAMHLKFAEFVAKAKAELLAPAVGGERPAFQAFSKFYVEAALMEEDGVTPYSKDYWAAAVKGEADFGTAVHETLAEMSRLKYTKARGYKSVFKGRPHYEGLYKATLGDK